MTDPGVITPEIIGYPYAGGGTHDDTYVVEWIPNGPRNPMQFNIRLKWTSTIVVAFAVLIVLLASSAYAGSLPEILKNLDISSEAGTLDVSVSFFGFDVGPLLWAPLSEVIGRQAILRWPPSCFPSCVLVPQGVGSRGVSLFYNSSTVQWGRHHSRMLEV